MQKRYDDAIAFTFSSAFSISPDTTEDPALVSNTEDSDDEDTGPLPGHLVIDDVTEWYTPPPPTASAPLLTVGDSPAKILPSTPFHCENGSSFELGMSLSFYNGRGNSEMVIYKGVMSNA